MRPKEAIRSIGNAIQDFQRARIEKGLKLREEQLFQELFLPYSTLLAGIQQKLPKPSNKLRSLPAEEKKLWVTREMARIYIPEGRHGTKDFSQRQLNLVREVFARGYLELTKPGGGTLKGVAEALGISWNECISLFYQTGPIVTNSVLEEVQKLNTL